jgi:hypothetical protein
MLEGSRRRDRTASAARRRPAAEKPHIGSVVACFRSRSEFLFEAREVEWIVDELIDDAAIAAFFDPWKKLMEGRPRLAHERFYWSRADQELGVGLGT